MTGNDDVPDTGGPILRVDGSYVGVGIVLVGLTVAAVILAATAVSMRGPEEKAAHEPAEREQCAHLCYPFEPTEVIDGDLLRGDAALGMGVQRAVVVRLFGFTATSTGAAAFTREWTRTGSITLCVEPKAQTGDRVVGQLCTRDSCLGTALFNAGHGDLSGGK